MSKFSENLKKLRLEKGYSQAALAEMIGVSQNAVYNWENEKREPRIDQREKLAELFQVSEVYLMYGMTEEEYNKFQRESRKKFATKWNEQRQREQLIKEFSLLNNEGKRKVIEYTNDIKDNPKYQKEDTE